MPVAEIVKIATMHANCKPLNAGWTCGTPGEPASIPEHALQVVEAALAEK